MAVLSPARTHYLTVRGDHPLRLHPNCVLYAARERWPKWILFTKVFLSSSVTSRFEQQQKQQASDTVANQKETGTCIAGVSAIDHEWLLELAPHYFQFGTDREHLMKN